MSRKKLIGLLVILLVAIFAWYGYREYTRTNKDLQKVKPDYVVTAEQLIKEFETQDSVAGNTYNGKILEVKGSVKMKEQDENGFYTIILGNTDNFSAVRCAIDTVYNREAATVREKTSIIIRGACTGFNKDEMGLGSDVILNRCVIIQKQ